MLTGLVAAHSLTLKCSLWLHRLSSHFRHSVPSWSGIGDIAPYCSSKAPAQRCKAVFQTLRVNDQPRGSTDAVACEDSRARLHHRPWPG